MTVYPDDIDSDQEINRIDDNLTEIGQETINQLRDAVFAIESELGTNPAGSAGSLAARLAVSLNDSGSIKASALSSIGLVTLPITNSQVGSNAGISESKLDLYYSTSDLHTLIIANSSLLSSLTTFANKIFADLNLHITGATLLSDSSPARHVLSHIDINDVPSDSRDSGYTWTGLKDKNDVLRSATNAADALLQINDDLIDHENATADAHVATAISVDTSNFEEIPLESNTVQKVLDYLDNADRLNLGEHRATQHANAIPKIARARNDVDNDGYRDQVVSSTPVNAYLVHPPNTSPVDDLSFGDDIIKFVPTNTSYAFDAQFSQVKVGDIITVDYGNGLSASFPIESIRYSPGSEWIVRINGVNLCESSDGYASARIDHALYDTNTYGVLAVAAANCTDGYGVPFYTDILSSVIVGHPQGANALGLNFDPGQLNSTHYKLYIQFYPTGNPQDHTINLPYIDVTGNSGATPGKYTLESVVQSTNDSLRRIGYNFRLIAYSYNGEFGLMIADPIGGASFSIVNGVNTSGALVTGSYTENVIGGSSLDSFDPLGFGSTGANIASPAYQSTWVDATAALSPTKVIVPLKRRNYIVNGIKRDTFIPTYLANSDGYWDGYISARNEVGGTTVEVTYTVALDLSPAGLKPGKTIVVQPTVSYSDPLYNDVDYGRFIIKSVTFTDPCGTSSASTQITVINGIHASGSGFASSSSPTLDVRLYFSADSVDFDSQNLVDSAVLSTDYSRHHEIFVSDDGKTFSHERARLPRQSESSTKIATTNWHIINVSPKLRGYAGSNPLVLNKYIRLVIQSYDSSTGEFDGYIGQIGTTSTEVLKMGPVTTGRKNQVVRFYDETNIDYIELLFDDNSTSPGISIMSDNTDRVVDIEIFRSLRTDDEFLFLATCEVIWDPSYGTIVQNVRDARQFGSIDDIDFTQSALDYISAADKYLHQNGVIRGLDLDYISGVANSGEIYFKGGQAIVNGTIVSVNNCSVTIPQIRQYGISLPQVIDWAICVNESGLLVPIILTSSKQQFFASSDGVSSYYVPSVTFLELVNSRKDLTPIAIATATISSLSISDVSDCRRILVNEDYHAPLVWAQDDGYVANFYNITALKQWINSCGGFKNHVKVYGKFIIADSSNTHLDLTGFEKEVIFDGLESLFDVAGKWAFWVGSNVTLKNFTFNYSHVNAAYTANGLFNFNPSLSNRANACIIANSGTDLENITIENCTFNYTGATQRPPFIVFNLVKNQVDKNIKIINNKFNDINPDGYLGESQAAIGFWSNNSGASSEPAILLNVDISGNICSHTQSIFITTTKGSSGAESPGIGCYNVSIKNNMCGVIGALNSGVISTNTEVINPRKTTSLIIEGNTCNLIGNLYGEGNEFVQNTKQLYGTGNIVIRNNTTNWIIYQVLEISASNQYSTIEISGNKLYANTVSGIPSLITGLSASTNFAIWVFEVSNSDSVNAIISNNQINFGYFDGGTYDYLYGIGCYCSGIITSNTINGLGRLGYGILALNGSGTVARTFSVTRNIINRATQHLTNYIFLPASNGSHKGIVTDNEFDSTTVDGSSEATINNIPNNWIVTRNLNQTMTALLNIGQGSFSLCRNTLATIPLVVTGGGAASGNSYIGTTRNGSTIDYDTVLFAYDDTGQVTVFTWIIPLIGVIPENAKPVTFSVDYDANFVPSTSSSLQISIETTFGTDASSSIAWTTVAGTLAAVASSTQTSRHGKNDTTEGTPVLKVYATANGATACALTLDNIKLKFRF